MDLQLNALLININSATVTGRVSHLDRPSLERGSKIVPSLRCKFLDLLEQNFASKPESISHSLARPPFYLQLDAPRVLYNQPELSKSPP